MEVKPQQKPALLGLKRQSPGREGEKGRPLQEIGDMMGLWALIEARMYCGASCFSAGGNL